jgi:hypothetical protein
MKAANQNVKRHKQGQPHGVNETLPTSKGSLLVAFNDG